MKILLTGATGFIGSQLVRLLVSRGDQVTLVTRHPDRPGVSPGGPTLVGWLPELSGFDAVVNLAGEPILGKRWSVAQKRRLRESRVQSTRRIVDALGTAGTRPRVMVNASAIGYYGDRGDEVLDEGSSPGTGFLSELCSEWEAAALGARDHGVRTVLLRIGLVLGRDGGALKMMIPQFKFFAGGTLGSGRQWMSWIHRNDLCRLILCALDGDSFDGPLNGTAPNPTTNTEFTSTLARVLKRPAFLPAPKPILRLALGEVASILTDSQRCSAEKALDAGFEFEFPDLKSALRDLVTALTPVD